MPYTVCAGRVPKVQAVERLGSFSEINHAVIAANRNKFTDAMVVLSCNDRDPGQRG
jgi:hypothetical protein